MGLLDWLRPRPRARSVTMIARQLAEAVFELHPSAKDRVVLQLGSRREVVIMDVPATDPARTSDAVLDRALQTARVSALVAELATAVPTEGNVLTVMRDRVIWMPCVVPFNPPLP